MVLTMKQSSTGLSVSFAQAETDLINSEIYQQAIAQLTTLTGEALETAQNLLKLVGREAMRLAARQIAQHPQTTEATASTQKSEETQTAISVPKQSQVSQSREEQCRRIGRTLKEAREARGISQQQLHVRTHVPLYQIKALEEGRLQKLPEDVYLRGFIRQLANALGLNGVSLAATLSESRTAVVPSWHRDRATGGQLLPIHLYLGYTAVVAGAIGGISLMSHHNTMTASMEAVELSGDASTTLSPRHSSQSRATQAAASIAPPERMESQN